ncbi:hypothetical protein GCM10022204_23230 [Microlunatus aurantiacus]|uniref:Uncharacterized protein n=1 Tax=Microlunatus aurantiacus TaxID=446786 RepID=A0ABP7DJ70_9ACTN
MGVVEMTKLTCLLGRHDWRPGVDRDEQPYEKCERCGHYRYPGSGGKHDRHGELPMDQTPGSGLGGGAVGGF